MLGLCEQCIGDSLNSRQKSIIDRCVRKLYIDIARSKEKYIPVMSDFYDILMAQPEDEAKDIALSLELFVNGSLNIFNHRTNVDVDNRFTVYGIRDLGTELSPITMLVMMESIRTGLLRMVREARQHGSILMSFTSYLIPSILQNICSSSEESKKAGRSLYWYHAERSRSVAELYSNNNACKLRVCSTLKTGEYRQFQDGGSYRGIRGTASIRNQYCIGNGTY